MQAFLNPSLKRKNSPKVLAKSSFTRKTESPRISSVLKDSIACSNFTNISRPVRGSTHLPPSPHKVIPLPATQDKSSSENIPADVERQLSLIKDPLWKRICSEIVRMMGPIAVQVFQVELGVPQDKTMDIYCKTKELAHFIQTYNFVILASLQRYFPSLKTLNVQGSL